MRAMLMRVPRCSNIQPRMKSTALLLKDSINCNQHQIDKTEILVVDAEVYYRLCEEG